MNHDKINNTLNRISILNDNIDSKRIDWNNRVYPLLQITLSSISNTYVNGLYIVRKEYSGFSNLGVVSLNLPNFSTGIIKTDTNNNVLIRGGKIVFAQMISGDIFISIEYPYMDFGLRNRQENESLARVDPRELTPEHITNYVNLFLEKIELWLSEK